jgi:hypothetical protein
MHASQRRSGSIAKGHMRDKSPTTPQLVVSTPTTSL